MTPAEKLGYKIGDYFTTEASLSFTDGSIVRLYIDDGTDLPMFELITGKVRGEEGAFFTKKLYTKLTSVHPCRPPTFIGMISAGLRSLVSSKFKTVKLIKSLATSKTSAYASI
jgi:hypothetical protein